MKHGSQELQITEDVRNIATWRHVYFLVVNMRMIECISIHIMKEVFECYMHIFKHTTPLLCFFYINTYQHGFYYIYKYKYINIYLQQGPRCTRKKKKKNLHEKLSQELVEGMTWDEGHEGKELRRDSVRICFIKMYI